MAIRTRQPLALSLPSLVWRGILGEEIVDSDIAVTDPSWLDDIQPAFYGAIEMLGMLCDLPNGAGRLVEIAPPGSITPDNVMDVVEAYKTMRRTEFNAALLAMQKVGLSAHAWSCSFHG